MLTNPLTEENSISPGAGNEPDKQMGIFDHLEELRSRLIKVIIVLTITTTISFFLAGWIFEALKSRVEGVELIRTQVGEMLATYMKVSFISGIALAMPFLVYQLVMFIAPALKPNEKRAIYLMLPAVFFSFALGAAFAFFVLLPPALGFLVHFGEDIAKPLIRIGDYISVIFTLTLWIGLAFETPIVIFLLARIGLVTPSVLARYRRHAIVGAFLLGAFITPTVDPFNETLVAIPLIVLYEIGIQLAKIASRQRQRSSEQRLP